MIIKQLSVFLENKTGRINDVTGLLGEAGINMTAFSMAENSDFGILRVIVSDPDRAYRVLKDNHFAVSLTDVICICCPNEPGAMSHILSYLADEQVFIEYMYAFSSGDVARVVIRPNHIEACIEVLRRHKQDVMTAKDL